MESQDRNLAPRLGWWWFAAPLVVSAAVRDLWAPDEPRYAMIARWCFEQREFLILRRCGELYPDKPPFLYWTAGFLGWISGWSVLAMRLVPVAATCVSAALVARLARRWFGELEARWAPILFLGFALVAWHGARLQLDPVLMAACTAALYFADAPAESTRQASRQALLAGACLGIAAFDKGPVAFVDAGLPLLLWRAFGLRAPGPRASRWAFAGALALAVLPVLSWASIASYVEPALFRPLFFGQHFERAIEGSKHRGPPWQHLVEMPLYLLPWSATVVLGLVEALRAFRARRRGEPYSAGLLRAGLWFASLFLFFSIIPPKRDLYLLPSYPACALLGASCLASALRRARIGLAQALVPLAVLGALGVSFGAAALLWLVDREQFVRWTHFEHEGIAWRAALIALPFALGAVLGVRALVRRRHGAWASSIALAWLAGLVALYALVAPLVNPLTSDRPLAELLHSLPQHPSEIPIYGLGAEGPRFYGGGPCVPAEDSGALDGEIERRAAEQGAQFLAVLNLKLWQRMSSDRRRPFAVVANGKVGLDQYVVLGRAP